MSNVEFWGLIISAVSAIGTLAAVCLSLWLAFPNWKKYKVKNIRVSAMMKGGKLEESMMLIMIENRQNVPMEIQYIEIVFRYNTDNHTAHQQWNYKNEFIPALSQYEIKAGLKQEWCGDELRKADKVTINLKTSLGDQTLDFPKSYLSTLFKCLEIPNETIKEAA